MPSAASDHRLRILLYNVGYQTELSGSLWSYLLGFYRYLYTPGFIMRRVRRSVYELLDEYHPDVCCFAEMHRKRASLHPRSYTHHDADVKYGPKSWLRRIPFFRDNCNGFLSHQALPFRKLYFSRGTKRLIYEIQLNASLRVLFVHLALSARVRRVQCEELAQIVLDGCPAIVCGDFNVFRGTEELTALTERCGLKLVNGAGQATFPAFHPRKALDLFLCPPQFADATVTVLGQVHESDHLPVLLEIGA